MNVHLINPSSVSFGTAVITPRWQYVLAAATPKSFGDPILVDETLFQMDPDRIQAGDAVGIGIHTANALRGYEIGKMARERGAQVIFGGIHATLYPRKPSIWAAHTRWLKVMGTLFGQRRWRIVVMAFQNRSTWEGRSRPAILFRPAGT